MINLDLAKKVTFRFPASLAQPAVSTASALAEASCWRIESALQILTGASFYLEILFPFSPRGYANGTLREQRGCACLVLSRFSRRVTRRARAAVAFYAGGNLRLTRRYGRLRQRLKSRRGFLGVRFSQDNANDKCCSESSGMNLIVY